MSKVTKCDGCGEILAKAPAISGQRANGLGGGGLPAGEFDWCTPCAQIAFRAVESRKALADFGKAFTAAMAPLAANLRQIKVTPGAAIIKGQRHEATADDMSSVLYEQARKGGASEEEARRIASDPDADWPVH